MWNILFLTATLNAVIVSSQPLTNTSLPTTTATITKTTETTATTATTTVAETATITTNSTSTISKQVKAEISAGNTSSPLSANQHVYHTTNASYDTGAAEEQTSAEPRNGINLMENLDAVNSTSELGARNSKVPLAEASLDIHLLENLHRVNDPTSDPATEDVEAGSEEASQVIDFLDDPNTSVNTSSDSETVDVEAVIEVDGLVIDSLDEPNITANTSSVSGVTDTEELFTEVSPNIQLESETHNCTENLQNETLEITCPDSSSLYNYAKKKFPDEKYLKVRVTNVSGAFELSQIIGLSSALKELDLSSAGVTEFSNDKHSRKEFKDMLKLGLNGNTEFKTSSFAKLGDLPNLKTLELHGLKLNNGILSDTFLEAAPNIEHLDISNTGLEPILSTEYFKSVPNLKSLDASMNDLHVLELEKTFFSKVTHLNVSHCKLQRLDIENDGNQIATIEVLDVSHNNLHALKSGLVSHLKVDAALYVNDNEWECSSCSLYHLWEYIQKRTAISGGSHIKSCFDLSSLANCDWDECPCSCTCTKATKTVDCTGTAKSMIPGVGPSDTQVLILKNNKISSLQNINSSSWCQLREIRIDHNMLSNFDTSNLQGSCSCKQDYEEDDCFPQSLTKISASYNNIGEIQSEDCAFLNEAKFLNLSHNEMKKIGTHNCGHLILKELDISYNWIANMTVGDLATIPLIENLILSNNQLTYFYRYQKNYTPKLKSLDLSHNKISRIEDRLRSNDTKSTKGWEFDPEHPFKLDELYLHSNQLGDSGGILQVTKISKSLKTITLHDNPWLCDCTFCETSKEFDFATMEGINKMVCQQRHPKNVIGFLKNCTTCNKNTQRTSDERKSDDNEEIRMEKGKQTKDSLNSLIVIVVIGMFLVGLFLWLCKCNSCVTRTLNGGQTEAELADETLRRRYDVFVVHSGEDRDFVNDNVITPLVAKGYLVAWHENMFTPGNYIYENIEKAVKQSRRMLVVATGNFTKSHWGLKEIRRGRHEEVDVHGYKITALVTSCLPQELRPELYQIVQERTHVAFSDRDYIEKICNFLPRPDPRMVSLNSTLSNNSLNQFVRQVLAARDSLEGNGDAGNSRPTVYQVFHDAKNNQITFNSEPETQAIDDASNVPECITIDKTRFKILPVIDESYNRNAIHSRISFRRRLSGASSVETFPAYTCLPPAPDNKDDEEEFSGSRFSRGILVRVTCRF